MRAGGSGKGGRGGGGGKGGGKGGAGGEQGGGGPHRYTDTPCHPPCPDRRIGVFASWIGVSAYRRICSWIGVSAYRRIFPPDRQNGERRTGVCAYWRKPA